MSFHGTILLAADFSKQSRQAFRLACSLAGEGQGRVLVLHVAGDGLDAWPTGDDPRPLPCSPLPWHRALHDRLRDVYMPDRPARVEYRVRDGFPAEAILHAAREVDSGLIVMGTHGRTGLNRLLAGGVAEAVLRRARCPVMALRTSEGAAETAGAPRVILHPTDFSDESEAAMLAARDLARDRGARLVILHVTPAEALFDGTAVGSLDPLAYLDALEALREGLDGPDLAYPVETVLAEGEPGPEILRVAEELDCGSIVLGTHGRTGLGRALMGGVAQAVLRRARRSVLAVRCAETAASLTYGPAFF